MLKKIALATIAATALVAPPSLVHAATNGLTINGITLKANVMNGRDQNGTAGRGVYFVSEQAGTASSTVLTIELPQDDVTH